MFIALFFVSGLATASVVSQHLGKPTSDTNADKGNAPSGFVQPQTGGPYADPGGNPRDSTYPVQSEPQNMAEEKNAETSSLSLSQAAGFMGDAALTDSDVESVLASDIGSELHSLQANEQTFGDAPESDLDGGSDENVNTLVGSDDATGQTVKQQQNYSSQILAGEGLRSNGVKAALSSSSSSSSKGLYSASVSEGEPLRRGRRAALSLQRALWPSGIVPYEIRSIFSSSSVATIMKGMRAWENISCVTFVQREPHHHTYIIFTILRCGCCSHVGLKCTGSPQAISIAPSCESVGEVMHQLGHVLGFYHEQSRPDRDDFVEILSDNILPGAWNEFAKRPSTYIDSLGEPYDYESIMHLKNNEFTKPGKNESIRPLECCPPPKIGQRVKISEGDIRQVNKLYKCPSCGRTLLERSGTFASPQVEPLRPTTETSDRQHKSEMPREEFDDSQELDDAASEDAKTTPEMPSTITLSTQSQAQNFTSGALFCQWRIGMNRGEHINITFTHMNMLPPTNQSQNDTHNSTDSSDVFHHCREEFVEVKDGYSPGSPVIGRYCGTNLPPTLLSSNMRMLVEYTRPAGQSGTGFVANYRVECGYVLSGEKGSFFLPEYASDRLPNDKCIWRIQFPVGFYAYIRFHDLQINQTQDCLDNYLEIFDGPSESSPSLYKLCSNDGPERLFSTGNEMIFRFVLNGSIGRQGFLARYTKEADCGGHLKADQGTFTSPKYPNWCPPNQKCDWKIEVPFGFSINLLLRGSLNHEKWSCLYEYIEIYDGPSRFSPLLRKLCGHDIPTTIGSTNNTMTVRFVSGRYERERTLKGEFRKASCGGTFNADIGHIAVPRYPSNHLPNNECTWKIEVPVGFHIALTKETFGMTKHPQCLYDYLEVFDGPSESSPSLYKLCGLDFPPTIWSTNNTMTVRFVVNSSIEGQFFEANYRKQDPCGGYLEGDQGNFTSPGYPITYPKSVKCVWKIEAPAKSYIVLTFDNIELEWEWRCANDYVEIFDGPSESSPLLGKFCGSDIPAPINSTNNTMTVRFISDRSRQEYGFAANFKKEAIA
ncbi:Bone morphoproteintic protein 1 [Sparganum proliferum]